MSTITTVTVTRALVPRIHDLTREHGSTFKYQRHMDQPHLAVLVTCLCPTGHGPTHVPWQGWLTPTVATLSLGEAQAPPSPYAVAFEPSHGIDLDLVGVPLPAAA